MTTVRYGYSSKGIDGRTDDENEKTFADVSQAEDWAWTYVCPGWGVRGVIERDVWEFDAYYLHSFDATWTNAVDPEPYTVRVWAEWTEEK